MHSLQVMQEHFGQPADVGSLIQGLPIAQAEQLRDASKTEATKAKWAKIVAELEADRGKNSGVLPPDQVKLANQITEAVNSGMSNLNLGKPFDPDDLNLTYIEPDPLGDDDIYSDTEEEKGDDELTRIRKEAKKSIVASLPKNLELRAYAEKIYSTKMEKLLNSTKYQNMRSMDQKTARLKLIESAVIEAKNLKKGSTDRIDSGFKQAESDYTTGFDDRKLDEDALNDADKKIIEGTVQNTLKEFQINNTKDKTPQYLPIIKLREISKHYGLNIDNRETRKQLLRKLYLEQDFVERATRGYFGVNKTTSVADIRKALNLPLDIAQFKPKSTPNTMGKKVKQQGSGFHSTWRKNCNA
jgi:hypothetical protein